MTAVRDFSLIQSFAMVVKERRHALKISQEELAWRAGVDRTFVARLELAHNQPSLSVLFALAKALDVAPDELLRETYLAHAKLHGKATQT